MMDLNEFFQQQPVLLTQRLVLRELRMDDAAGYLAFAGDPRVTRYLRWGPHASQAETERYLARVVEDYQRGSSGLWGIEWAQEGKLIGCIHLMEIDAHDLRADVGVVLNAHCWGKWFGSEALRRVLAFSFGELRLERVQGLVITGNTAGCRLMERCGMTREGLLRRYALQKGEWWDFDLYSMLKDELD